MPNERLDSFISKMQRNLRTTKYDPAEIRNRQREILEAQTEAEENEPGQPEKAV